MLVTKIPVCWKPTFRVVKLRKLRTKSSAPIKRTTERPTCETMRMRRRLNRSRPLVAPRLPDCSSVAGSARVARKAGVSPKEMVVTPASPVVNARTRQSIPRSRKIRFCSVLMKATSIRLIANAKNNPQIDPAAASNRLSESSSRTIRQRVAPSARRMVI